MKRIVLGMLIFSLLVFTSISYGANIFNVQETDLSDSTVEYTITIGSGFKPVKGFIIQNRADNDFRFSFHENGTSDTYYTIKAEDEFKVDNIRFYGDVYVRDPANDSATIETITW